VHPRGRIWSMRGSRGARGRGGEGRGGEGRGVHPRGRSGSARMFECVRADAPIYSRGNLITYAIVRLSHRRPNSHRLIVRPSVRLFSIVHVTTLYGGLEGLL
jgi:hypothetical protein